MTKYEYTEVVEDNHSAINEMGAEEAEAEMARPLASFADALTKASAAGWEMVNVYGARPYRSALMRRVATPAPEDIPPALISPSDYDRCFQPDLTLQKVAGNRAWLGLHQASGMDATHLAVLVESGAGLALFGRTFLPDNKAAAAYGEVFGRTHAMASITSVMGQFVPDDVLLNVVAALCGTFDVNGIGLDPYQAHTLAPKLIEAGYPVLHTPDRRDTTGPAMLDVVTSIWAGRLVHDGDPILRAHILDLKASEPDKMLAVMSRHPVGSPLRGTGVGMARAAAFANMVRINSMQMEKAA